MQAVLISSFNYYDNRLRLVDRFLTQRGYQVTYITTDYDTVRRQSFVTTVPNAIQIPVIPYQKNLSFERIWSHIRFAQDVKEALETLSPQLVFCMLPPNALGRAVIRYKKDHPDVRVIFDIYDMWPESFPIIHLKKWLTVPFYFWRNLREQALKQADGFTYECKLYRNMLLPETVKQKPHAPFYLAQEPVPYLPFEHPQEELRFLYLGSINNVVDFKLMVDFLERLHQKRPVYIDIIGGGENQKNFIDALRQKNIPCTFHGMIFDDQVKHQIVRKVHYGLNVFKDQLTVGLTMKSVDYFKFALPIINTIGGDTEEWLDEWGIGYQLDRNQVDVTVDQVLSTTTTQWSGMSQSAKHLFDTHFSTQVVQENLNHFLNDLLLPEKRQRDTERGQMNEK